MLNMRYELVIVPLIQIAYCLVIHTCRFTSAILSDVSICEFNVFGLFYEFHKIAKPLALYTICVQFIKQELHIIIFGVADFLFL